MKTFAQFLNEDVDNLEEYRRACGGYIKQHINQSRSVKANVTTVLEKCVDAMDDAPFDAIAAVALQYYNNQADHNIRKMDKIRQTISKKQREIQGWKTALGNCFTVSMPHSLSYQLHCLDKGDISGKVNYSKIDMWAKPGGGRYMYDSIIPKGEVTLSEAVKIPYPSVNVRKAAVFLQDNPSGTNAHKSLEEWKDAFIKSKYNAACIKELFNFQLMIINKILDPYTLCLKLEDKFKSGNYREAEKLADDLGHFMAYFDSCKRCVGELGRRYFDIFGNITAIG